MLLSMYQGLKMHVCAFTRRSVSTDSVHNCRTRDRPGDYGRYDRKGSAGTADITVAPTCRDYNTRFSGITAAEMQNVDISLRDVQQMMMELCNPKTILIGHSLESDLIVLKVIHDTVVDTSVVFPHRLGPPYKRTLKTLAEVKLHRIIQRHGKQLEYN